MRKLGKLTLFSVVCATLLFTGCGSSSSTPVSTDTTTSGTVSGSLYEGAKVCLDTNANGKCDAGETSTTSAADGTFTLTGDPDYDVVAEIGATAKKHTVAGDNGTLVGSGNIFTFLAPRLGVDTDGSLIISSISTKVWSAMKENNETLAQAKTSVAATIGGIDAADLLENFNGSGLNTAKKAALQARVVAETTNIKAAMVSGVLDLTSLKTKMTEDVVSATTRGTSISGLTMPKQVDAVNASAN